MSKCNHDLVEREMEVHDGCCPICLKSENARLQRLVNGIKKEAQMYKQCYIKSLEHLGLSGDDICPNAEEFICLLKKIKEENFRLKEMLERMAGKLEEIANVDYRGNRPSSSVRAYQALAEYRAWKEKTNL